MNNLKQRLNLLREQIQKSDFLEGKGLSNEVNIRIFCYEPNEELTISNFVEQLHKDTSLACRIIEYNLYSVFLRICEDLDILSAIPSLEEEEGSAFLLAQLHSAVGAEEFLAKMQYSPHARGDVLLLTGVGDVFPFMRIHLLLEALQPHFADIPIVVFYPGEYTGNSLKLFNILQSNDYYRAFRIF